MALGQDREVRRGSPGAPNSSSGPPYERIQPRIHGFVIRHERVQKRLPADCLLPQWAARCYTFCRFAKLWRANPLYRSTLPPFSEETMAINRARVWLGGVAGGVVWSIWSFLIGMWQAPQYAAAESQGWFLKQSRYPRFPLQWIL